MMARKRSILYLTNKGLQLDLSAHALSKLFARYEIFILDEYGNKGWGESDAVDAFFVGQAVKFERFGWSSGPGAYFVKQTPG